MTNNYTTMIRRIGKTTYNVKVFCRESGETMEAKNDEACGIITIPQMSRQSERSA